MNVDIRFPMGLMFSITGLILVVYSFLTPQEIYRQSLGLNINLWWGLAILAFGGVMLYLALRTMLARKADTRDSAE
ncbi:MAG: hypothetical protein R6V10_01325 [bacterium]